MNGTVLNKAWPSFEPEFRNSDRLLKVSNQGTYWLLRGFLAYLLIYFNPFLSGVFKFKPELLSFPKSTEVDFVETDSLGFSV